MGIRFSLLCYGQQFVEAPDTALPDLLIFFQQTVGTAYRFRVAGDSLCPPIPALGHKVGALKYRHVFLNGGKRHPVPRRQLTDRRFAIHDSGQDVASCRIGQSPKQAVEGFGRLRGTYNHLVVR